MSELIENFKIVGVDETTYENYENSKETLGIFSDEEIIQQENFKKKFMPKSLPEIYRDAPTLISNFTGIKYKIIQPKTTIFKAIESDVANARFKPDTSDTSFHQYLRRNDHITILNDVSPVSPTWYGDLRTAMTYALTYPYKPSSVNRPSTLKETDILVFETTNDSATLLLDMNIDKQQQKAIIDYFSTYNKKEMEEYMNTFIKHHTENRIRNNNKDPIDNHYKAKLLVHQTLVTEINNSTNYNHKSLRLFFKYIFKIAFGRSLKHQIKSIIKLYVVIFPNKSLLYLLENLYNINIISFLEEKWLLVLKVFAKEVKEFEDQTDEKVIDDNSLLASFLLKKNDDDDPSIREYIKLIITDKTSPNRVKLLNGSPTETDQHYISKHNTEIYVKSDDIYFMKLDECVKYAFQNDNFKKDSWELDNSKFWLSYNKKQYKLWIINEPLEKRWALEIFKRQRRISQVSIDMILITLLCFRFSLSPYDGFTDGNKITWIPRGYIAPELKDGTWLDKTFHAEMCFCWAPYDIKLIARTKFLLDNDHVESKKFFKNYLSYVLENTAQEDQEKMQKLLKTNGWNILLSKEKQQSSVVPINQKRVKEEAEEEKKKRKTDDIFQTKLKDHDSSSEDDDFSEDDDDDDSSSSSEESEDEKEKKIPEANDNFQIKDNFCLVCNSLSNLMDSELKIPICSVKCQKIHYKTT